ncbi:hypothetical protein [Chamaesiphon sp.]|uniref:hypothetical protein n=1 Tax=Chamaesiphon sp. TaxID=2814140 RepID=UPI003593642B
MSATEPLLDKPSDMADVSDIFLASFSRTIVRVPALPARLESTAIDSIAFLWNWETPNRQAEGRSVRIDRLTSIVLVEINHSIPANSSAV